MSHTFATINVPAHLCVSGRALMLPAVCDAVITALPPGVNIAHTRWEHGALTVYVAAPASRWPTVQDLERGLQAARAAVAAALARRSA
jgi:hypothetical protein